MEAMLFSVTTSPGWKTNILESGDQMAVKGANDDNERITFNRLSKLLLARWIVFDTFIKVARSLNNGVLPDDIKHRWLLFQIRVNEMDPFLALIDSCLVGVSTDQLRELNTSLSPTTILSSESEFNPLSDLFHYVLDEAQVAGHQSMGAFVDAGGTTPRPILRPIIRHLTSTPNPFVKVIVSGTGFSLSLFKTVFTSGVGKSAKRTQYATGDFANQDAQLQYVTRYLPPGFLQSPSGISLIDRLHNWLRGRYVIQTNFSGSRLIRYTFGSGTGSLLGLLKSL
jgi:hypothetical protein